jgi:iron complex outermembrane receptor protein
MALVACPARAAPPMGRRHAETAGHAPRARPPLPPGHTAAPSHKRNAVFAALQQSPPSGPPQHHRREFAMRIHTIRLLATTAVLVMPGLALAQAPAESDAAEEVIVFGRGETRQVQEIQADDILRLTPGTSPLKAIEKLPGVNFQAADPFGNYEWSTRVTIRSFNQNQLGFNFDGIPLGDMTYGNHNGLHISRVISPENIGSVRVSQGAGALGTQSTNNLGGTVETFSSDPADRFAAQAGATYGSDETMRGFVRLDLGVADGPAGFISYGYGATDKYKGNGTQDQHLVNAKIVVPVGEGALDGWLSYSDRREQDYQDMSLDMLGRLGYGWDNSSPDYASALLYADVANNIDNVNNSTGAPGGDGLSDLTGLPPSNAAAGTTFPGNVTNPDDAYYDASGLRKDTLAALGFSTPLSENGSFKIRTYYHHNKGVGTWATPYVPSPNGVPISMRTTEYDMDRVGVFASVNMRVAGQDISVGAWYENNKFNQARRFYAYPSRTEPLDHRRFPTNPFATQWEFDFNTDTFQYFVQDKIKLGMLTVNLGWKGYKVTNEADAIVAGSFPEGKIGVTDWFQPHAGFNVALGDTAEIFGGFTQVTRAYASATTTGPFSTNQLGFDGIKDKLKPEQSDTYELGLRYNDPVFNGTAGVYLVNFRNRLLSVATGPSIVGAASTLQNVGAVRAVGFEAAGDLKLATNVRLFASYTYTDATYRNDVYNVSNVLLAATAGKTVVDSPRHMIRGELSYDDGALFGRIGANYMSKRYFNYLNDRSVPGRTIVDATLGYRFMERYEIQLNASNLFDETYIATVGSGGYGNSGDRQTLLVGAPQQIFATLKAGF